MFMFLYCKFGTLSVYYSVFLTGFYWIENKEQLENIQKLPETTHRVIETRRNQHHYIFLAKYKLLSKFILMPTPPITPPS